MTSPVPTPARLPEALLHKLLAVRLQLEAYDREIVVAQLQARNAVLERDELRRNLPPLEQQALAELKAPEGARFNWQTFSADPQETAHAPSSRAAVEPAE